MKARALALSALSLAISIPLATAYSGDMTYYTPAADATNSACNIAAQPGEPIVAISYLKFGSGNPNNDPLCGSYISIYNPYNGQTLNNVKVVDKCMGCKAEDIDVNVELFGMLGLDSGRGRVQGMDWGEVRRGGRGVWGLNRWGLRSGGCIIRMGRLSDALRLVPGVFFSFGGSDHGGF